MSANQIWGFIKKIWSLLMKYFETLPEPKIDPLPTEEENPDEELTELLPKPIQELEEKLQILLPLLPEKQRRDLELVIREVKELNKKYQTLLQIKELIKTLDD